MSNGFEAGVQVRLISDPGREGILSGQTRDRRGVKMHFVHFPDSPTWLREEALELLDSATNNTVTMLEKKQFGRLSDYRRNLTSIQLSGKLANLIYSMNTTNTEFYAYQYKPVLSFLDSPSKGILIADEVGLGKTIEAGLIWTELRARYDTRRLLIVCPAMLREKWKDELAYRFGIQAKLLNADELAKELSRDRHSIPPGQAIVCSYDGIRPPRASGKEQSVERGANKLSTLLETMSGEEPLIDLVIFDEAHKMRNPESATAKLGRLLRDVSDKLILLSATPINLHSNDLYHLLNIADEDTFSDENIFPAVLDANEPLIRARNTILDRRKPWRETQEILMGAQFDPLLSESQQLANLLSEKVNEDALDDAERIRIADKIERCNLLSKVVTRTRKRDVKELRVIREAVAPQIDMTEQEQDLYLKVTNVVRQHAQDLDISEGFLLATPQRQLSSSMYAAVRSWQKRSMSFKESAYEDLGIEVEEEERGTLLETIIEEVLPEVDSKLLRDNDSKFDAFLHVVSQYFNDFPSEKIIVFSYFRETLRYLSDRLSELGFCNEVLMGGMKESKQSILNRFKENPECKILLASEVASEGVDLQFCQVLINYDLPWNPMKIEQRIGRIDRHGQKAEKIKIFNFCYDNTIDQRIYERLFQRLDIFQRALGDMEAILGEQISQLTRELFSFKLTPEQEEARIEQTSQAIERLRAEENALEEQASNLIAHSGHILNTVKAAHEFSKRITEADLVIYVKDYLEKHVKGFQFICEDENTNEYKIKLPGDVSAELEQFIQKRKLHGLTNLSSGHVVTCVFNNNVVAPTGKKEGINQTHPFIQFISFKLKELKESFVPLVALRVDAGELPGVPVGEYVASIKRFNFEGLRIEESLVSRIVRVEDEKLLNSEQSQEITNLLRFKGKDWLEARAEIDVAHFQQAFDLCDELLEDDFEREEKAKTAENEDRVNLQITTAKKHFERQIASLKEVLSRHEYNNRIGLVKATEGRIKKAQERYDKRLSELRANKSLKKYHEDVCHIALSVI